jgi:hypothetical protein
VFEYLIAESFRNVPSHNRIPKLTLLQQRQDMQTCWISRCQKHTQDEGWDLRDEFCVFSASEVFKVCEVIHERLMFEKLGLSKDYHQFARETIQFRYCGFERDCKNSKSASKRRRSSDSVMAKELKSMPRVDAPHAPR